MIEVDVWFIEENDIIIFFQLILDLYESCPILNYFVYLNNI